MTTDRCIHDMVPTYCHWCNGTKPAGRYPDKPPAFRAKRDGICGICARAIGIGHSIVALTNTDEFAHERCARKDKP